MAKTEFSGREILAGRAPQDMPVTVKGWVRTRRRSEEHTSELQSHVNLVCRLLLEKKKKKKKNNNILKHLTNKMTGTIYTLPYTIPDVNLATRSHPTAANCG